VNAKTKDKDGSLEYIKYLNRDDVMLEWLKAQHSLPCVYSLIDDPWFESENAKFQIPALKTVKDWVWMGAVGNKYAMDDTFYPKLEALSLGELSVQEMLSQLETELTAKVQSFMDETGYDPALAGL
ncbi:MAG: hypothetical protein ACYC5M_08330, partial [Anaerolineae bacterium]